MKFINLYIHSIGSKLRVKDQVFEVHLYKGNKLLKIEEYAAPQLRSIRLKRGTSLSVEAIHLAMEHEVDLLMENQYGQPIARINSPKPGSTTKILKAQLLAAIDGHGLEYVKGWLSKKLTYQNEFLGSSASTRPLLASHDIEEFIAHNKKLISKIKKVNVESIETSQKQIRAIEGEAGRRYFQLISTLLPKAYRFKNRNRQPATDPFNAFLNYGYGILYNRIESSLFRAGLSPYIGFLHRDGYQFKSLVFDFIEPYRVEVDKAMFQLFSRKKIKKAFFELNSDGIIIKRKGKQAIADAFSKHFEIEKNAYKDKHYALQQIMLLEAQGLAQQLLNRLP